MSNVKLTVAEMSSMIADLHPTLSSADHGKMLAAMIVGIDQEMNKPKAQPKATRTRKPQPKAVKANVKANWDGVMMLADAGTITKGQMRNITGIAERNGEPFDAAELANISKMSMVEASDFYHGLKADYAA